MKTIFYPLLAALLLSSCAVSHTPVEIAADDSNIQYTGRINFTDSLAPRFVYPGTIIKTRFTGTSVSMKAKPGSGYFMVTIDDIEPFKVQFGENDSIVALADSLANGTHSLEIMLATEGWSTKPEFYGLVLDGGAKLKPVDKTQDRRISFIGNSMTCGYGSEAEEGKIKYAMSNSNFYYSYAAITARELDAQSMVVARSGIGVYRNYNGNRQGDENVMPDWYDYTLLYDDSQRWDHSQFVPEVLCVNLGTNDLSTGNYEIDLYAAAYEKFMRHLRETHPTTKIVMLTGCMVTGDKLEVQKKALDGVLKALTDDGLTGFYRFDVSPQDGSLGYGADYHPSKAQHRKMADELIPFIKSITGWE